MRRPEFIARQAGRPSGWIGRLLTKVMALETAAANDVAIGLLLLQPSDRVLEIGFGHGRTLARIAAHVPAGAAIGLDHAPDMVAAARHRYHGLVAQRRMELHSGDSASLPFSERAFDKVLAVHTLYFWHPPEPHLAEIRRVLNEGGMFVLGYRPADDSAIAEFPPSVYTFYAVPTVERLLGAAGFGAVETSQYSPSLAFTTACALPQGARQDTGRA